MKPAYEFETPDGRRSPHRPRHPDGKAMDGVPYRTVIHDMDAYRKAARDGTFYDSLGGPITDQRKSPGT